jgi:hypothetical protein
MWGCRPPLLRNHLAAAPRGNPELRGSYFYPGEQLSLASIPAPAMVPAVDGLDSVAVRAEKLEPGACFPGQYRCVVRAVHGESLLAVEARRFSPVAVNMVDIQGARVVEPALAAGSAEVLEHLRAHGPIEVSGALRVSAPVATLLGEDVALVSSPVPLGKPVRCPDGFQPFVASTTLSGHVAAIRTVGQRASLV